MQQHIPFYKTATRYIAFFLLISMGALAQDRCGTMELLNSRFLQQPDLKIMFDQRETQLKEIIRQRIAAGKNFKTTAEITIPVVFHVVLNRQSQVTESQIQAQLDTINKDYAGLNAGAARIPAYFRSLFGQSNIRFCLAQRTPDDKPSTGIVRYTTTRNTFDYTTNLVKHAETGGADAWDPDQYLNIWVCDLASSTLGYATFPEDGVPAEQGVVIDYACLPGGSATGYNQGKTLTHELGHFFNLYHIWGDDNGSCTGTDQVEDTPNQANSTSACRTGVVTDNCTPSSPGIMYQNFMDYTPDNCLLMFTVQQVLRMESAFTQYRSALAQSDGCTPVSMSRNDASIKAITRLEQRLCSPEFTPRVTLVNRGSETLTSVQVHAVIDDGTVYDYDWTGSLASYAEVTLALSELTTGEGNHVLTVYTTNPNGAADGDPTNDSASLNFLYYEPFDPPVTESFESLFVPEGWDIVNEDGGSTWEKTNAAAKTGSASVRISNFDNEAIGERDYLRTPVVNIAGADSAFVSFQVAAATYTNPSAQGNVWDTLSVLISTDCGQTYTTLYKKWGSTLVTRNAATRTAFTPAASEWRYERINISDFIGQGEVLIAFVNTNGNENDVYLDDININTVVVNPNLKEAGFLVTPNPTTGIVSVQFYPHPANLKSVAIYNAAGQKVAEKAITGAVSTNTYNFNLTPFAAGLYVVQAVFTDRVLTKKIVKY